MSNSDIKTIFADLVVEMELLLGPELDRFISQRSVYKSADETDYEAALQAVEEAKARLESLESACISKAEQTGWYDKIESHSEEQQAELETLFEKYFHKEPDTDTNKEETPAPSINIPEPSVDSK